MVTAGPTVTAEITQRPVRIVGIDFLRAIAVLLVTFRHNTLAWLENQPRIQEVAAVLWQGGWLGVDLFFVLSGFLVSGLLFREFRRHGEVKVGRFLVRRGLKIYPAFYLFLIATVWYQGLRGGEWVPNLICEALFVQNYGPSLWNHTWSLAVEEHFYLGLALVILLLSRSGKLASWVHWTPIVLIVVNVLVLVTRIHLSSVERFHPKTHMFPTHLRIDSLLFGVLLAYFFHYHHHRFNAFCVRFRWPLLALGIGLLTPGFLYRLGPTPWIHTYGFTLFYLGAGAVLCSILGGALGEGRWVRGVAWVGSFSYSIYLWHMPVHRWLMPHLVRAEVPWLQGVMLSLIFIVTSFVCGIVLAKLVEIPALKVRDRIWPSRVGALRDAAG